MYLDPHLKEREKRVSKDAGPFFSLMVRDGARARLLAMRNQGPY
jgi:hypothetical protein